MTEYYHGDEARLSFVYLTGDGCWALVLRFGIKDFDRITAIEHIAAEKAAPQRWLDGAQLSTQALVNQLAPARVYEQQIQFRHSDSLPLIGLIYQNSVLFRCRNAFDAFQKPGIGTFQAVLQRNCRSPPGGADQRIVQHFPWHPVRLGCIEMKPSGIAHHLSY